jgi:hypothetical protein
MVDCTLCWNGSNGRRRIHISNIANDNNLRWKRRQTACATFFAEDGPNSIAVSLECDCIAVENTLIIALVHNDKQICTIFVTSGYSENAVRVCKISGVGEINELFYEESSDYRFIWGVDQYDDDLFSECYLMVQ